MASMKGVELKYIKKTIKKGPNPLSVKKKDRKQPDQDRLKSNKQDGGQGM